MSRRRSFRRLTRTLPLATLLAASLAACDDAAAPPVAPPTAPRFAKGSTQTRPDGKGIGTMSTKGDRTHQKVTYHGGAVLTTTPTVYVIWYGFWSGSLAVPVLTDFLSSLGGSSYFAINTLYPDANGAAPTGGLTYGAAVEDYYTLGTALTDQDVGTVVGIAVSGGQLPLDPNGIYVVLTSPDVDVTSGLGSAYCGYHGSTSANGVVIPFVFVGNTGRSLYCGGQWPSPNGSRDGDAMASILAAELSNAVTDPWFTAWYDKFYLEPADKCAWSYGATYTTGNGALANVNIGGRDYLLQQLWVPGGRTGACALELSAGLAAAAAS